MQGSGGSIKVVAVRMRFKKRTGIGPFSGVRRLAWVLGTVSCASLNGTPMRGSADCRYVPSVEDCWAAADRIEDFCLKSCVIRLCRGDGRVVCNESVQEQCVERAVGNTTGSVGGFVRRGPQTCEVPKEEVNWCQLPRSLPCQALIMIHELAHACGWHHFQGQGIPGDEGSVKCQ